jgi:Malate synthase
MAAFVPSRRDPAINEKAIAQVRSDKEREAGRRIDGMWVAHPDLVPVATEVFDRVVGKRPHQLDRLREDVEVVAAQLLEVGIDRWRSHRGWNAQQCERRPSDHRTWLRGVNSSQTLSTSADVRLRVSRVRDPALPQTLPPNSHHARGLDPSGRLGQTLTRSQTGASR